MPILLKPAAWGAHLLMLVCVAIAFFLNTGAYYGEILRAGIDSVPAGQVEAARSTGLGRLQALTYVVLPQAVRNVMPDLLSNTLEVHVMELRRKLEAHGPRVIHTLRGRGYLLDAGRSE